MNQKTLYAVVAILIVATAIFAYLYFESESEYSNERIEFQKKIDSLEKQKTQSKQRYIKLENKFDSVKTDYDSLQKRTDKYENANDSIQRVINKSSTDVRDVSSDELRELFDNLRVN